MKMEQKRIINTVYYISEEVCEKARYETAHSKREYKLLSWNLIL